jgi:hypothetical protein
MLLWSRSGWSAEYLPKVLFGLGAITFNVVCYYFVEKRTVEASNYRKQSTLILWVTFPGVICFVAAVYLGGNYAHWW